MRNSLSELSLPRAAISPDVWLWVGSLAAAAVAGYAHYAGGFSDVFRFIASLVAVAFTATTMGRAIEQVTGRLSPNAIGLFQAVTGNLPEIIIGTFALGSLFWWS